MIGMPVFLRLITVHKALAELVLPSIFSYNSIYVPSNGDGGFIGCLFGLFL